MSELTKTQTYIENSFPNKTTTYAGEPNNSATTGYDSSQSTRVNKTDAHGLGIGDEIKLNDKDYKITEIISGDNKTGEAIIYKIEDAAKKEYGLKLYYKFNPKDEPNPEALSRIMQITDPDILKLHDFGTNEKKYQNQYCFEVCDFAKGSNLLSVPDMKKKYSFDFIKSNVIPEILKGIKTLHDHKIYHCDLKPQNIFFLDKEQTDLIIGDYGSAKTFEESTKKESRRTSSFKGTDFYLAPEQARGIISEKNDYHSFGMILIHLIYPEYVTNRELSNKIIERQFSKKPIIDFDPEFGRINDLIAGLTLLDASLRWGEKEINAWLKGENVSVQYTDLTGSGTTPIKLGQVTIQTVDELIRFIEENTNWSEDLVEDTEGYGLFLKWISELQDLKSKKIFDHMVRTYQQDGEGFLKEAILRFFDPARPIQIEMKLYDFRKCSDFDGLMKEIIQHLDDIWKITSFKKMGLYIFQIEFNLRQLESDVEESVKPFLISLIDKLSSVFSVSPKPNFEDYICNIYTNLTDEKFIDLFYAFEEDRVFKDLNNNHYNSIEDVGLYFAKNEESFNNQYIKIERLKFFKAHNREDLSKYNYQDFLFEIFKEKQIPEIKFNTLSLDYKKNVKIEGSLFNSLTEFFKSRKIEKTLTYGKVGKSFYIEEIKRRVKLKKIFLKNVLEKLEAEFKIKQSKVARENLESFYSKVTVALKNEISKKRRHKAKIFLRTTGFGLICGIFFGLARLTIGQALRYRIDPQNKFLPFQELSIYLKFSGEEAVTATLLLLGIWGVIAGGIYLLYSLKN